MITGYEAFGIFQALKLHFTSDSYDFFKYHGKSKISVEAFELRKDKYHFYKLSRRLPNREELILFIVANLLHNDNLWVGDLLTEESETIFFWACAKKGLPGQSLVMLLSSFTCR